MISKKFHSVEPIRPSNLCGLIINPFVLQGVSTLAGYSHVAITTNYRFKINPKGYFVKIGTDLRKELQKN
jgi:hypothetical protein